MATMTPTTGANFIPEVWAKNTQIAREKRLTMAKLVKRYDDEVADYGDIIHIAEVSNLTVQAYTPGTDVTPQAPTEDKVDITVNRFYTAMFEIDKTLTALSKYRLAGDYQEKAGYALAAQVDTDLLGQFGSLGVVGTGSTAITDANLITGIRLLDDALAPEDNRYFVIAPSGKADLLAIDKFVRYDALGLAANQNSIINGRFGEIYGVEVFVSSNVPAVTTSPVTLHNCLFHQDAFGLAMQKDVEWSTHEAAYKFADIYKPLSMWGYGILRNDHAIDFRSTLHA